MPRYKRRVIHTWAFMWDGTERSASAIAEAIRAGGATCEFSFPESGRMRLVLRGTAREKRLFVMTGQYVRQSHDPAQCAVVMAARQFEHEWEKA